MAKLNARVQDRRILIRIGRELGRFDVEVRQARKEIAEDAEIIYKAFAPRDSGRLGRGIKARVRRNSVTIEARAVDPETGFDYVRVTRFGHRVPRIYAGQIARSLTGMGAFTRGGDIRRKPLRGAAALRTPYGPRASVRGFRPAGDWADPAFEAVEHIAQVHLQALGRGIVRRIG